jgi:hypothetical protein
MRYLGCFVLLLTSMSARELDPERQRLAGDQDRWRAWGPYLSERAWGTVREDYSDDGEAWDFFPHDHARSRTFRWSEDGLAGICDIRQQLCLAMSFWNGQDPILKERIFGLSGNEGNHGEDAKEYWWYLDATPTHSYLRWQYAYPQATFPYEELVEENRARTKLQPEYELIDTGIFDGGYWEITVEYAKADVDDVCARLVVRNRGTAQATISVLPTLWFRNTWSWGIDDRRPSIRDAGGALVAEHHDLGTMALAGSGAPTSLFCENDTNTARLFAKAATTDYPKDGINDHVVRGLATVNPAQVGTKAALSYRLTVEAGATAEIRLRFAPATRDLGDEWSKVFADRIAEADAFYRELTPPGATAEEAMIERQAFAGMIWSKQYYHYNVARWLDGDPAGPTPPVSRLAGRNSGWRHLDNLDVISMPDPWEYPWYASWDLAFHAVTFAHIDPAFAKHQLLTICREWYMHPNGQLPAYEWAFGDVNPPVHAWAALRIFEIDGGQDFDFLERMMHKLLLNFTWWVNRKDKAGNNVFEGGFLGLDNIGPIDRSAQFPGGYIEQSDGTAWMATYCLNMLQMALVLAARDPVYEDLATKFFEHFAYIGAAMADLWDDHDGFYYDVFCGSQGDLVPIRVRSMVGLISLYATMTLGRATLERLPNFTARMNWFLANRAEYADLDANIHTTGGNEGRLLAVVSPERLRRILTVMLDEGEFLSPHGLRALSAVHREHPFVVEIGGTAASVDYEPGESTSALFGGNSNWRGPVWFPVNYLVIDALRRYAAYFGDDFTIEHPTGSGHLANLTEIADDLTERLLAIFRDGPTGHRPVFGAYERFQSDPNWHSLLLFHEYFHGDTGAGLGASHQTGWTGLVADLLAARRPATPTAR